MDDQKEGITNAEIESYNSRLDKSLCFIRDISKMKISLFPLCILSLNIKKKSDLFSRKALIWHKLGQNISP